MTSPQKERTEMAKHSKPSNTKRNIKRAATVATGGAAVMVIGATTTPAVASPSDTAETTIVLPAVPSAFKAPAALPAPAPVVSAVTGDMVVAEARKHFGANYVWGGESDAEGGYDCSGLIFRVYADLGINVPRTSGALAGVGVPVPSLDQAQPGDILAWSGHAAIYVGNGRMIDSAKPGEVVKERAIWGTPTIRRVLTGAEVAPTPVPAEVAEAPVPVQEIPAPVVTGTVTVQPGDYLTKIARQINTDWHTLYANNREVIGDDPNLIYPGQVYFVGGLPLAQPPVKVEEAAPEVEVVVPAAPETLDAVGNAIISNSAGEVSQRTRNAANRVVATVRGAALITIGGTRASARDMAGHPSGNALDYMVMSDGALGNAIVQFHIDNWGSLGVDYLIYRQQIMLSPGVWKPMENRGSATQNHMDHVHVNYNP